MRNTLRLSVIALALFDVVIRADDGAAGRSHTRAVFRLQDRRRRRAGALSEDPRVLPAAREADRSRQVRGARQDDDGELRMRCCASARRRTWRSSIGWSRSTAGSPIRAACRTAEAQKLAAEGKPFYFVYATIHSTEVSQRPGDHQHRPSAGDRELAADPRDPRQRGRADGAVAESRRPAPGDRSLVQDEGHAVQPRLSRTCTTSTSATTTTATGSCSRRRKRA